MSDGLSDAEITRGLRRGDRAAWEALCQRYSSRVWRYVARLVGSDEEAVADVFQETMLAVAKAGRGVADGSRLWPWLAAIGHNQAALYWRKRYRERTRKPDTDVFEPVSRDTPEAQLARAETVQSVRGLLAEMNADHVIVLTAKYIDGLTVAEIVEQLGGSHESVRSRLARARRDFRGRFERLSLRRGEIETPANHLSPDASE